MLLTVFVDLIPKFLGITRRLSPGLSPLQGVTYTSWYCNLILPDDLTYYSFHRVIMKSALWAGYVSHHSSALQPANSSRQGVGERILKYPFWVPLALLGYHPAMIVTMLSVSLIYQYWLHTEAFYKFRDGLNYLQYPVASSGPPRPNAAPTEPRCHAHHLGSLVWHIPERFRGARQIRPHQKY